MSAEPHLHISCGSLLGCSHINWKDRKERGDGENQEKPRVMKALRGGGQTPERDWERDNSTPRSIIQGDGWKGELRKEEEEEER